VGVRTTSAPIGVLELTQTLSLGGLEKTVSTLAEALSQNRHFRVIVAAYDQPSGEPSFAAQCEEAGVSLVRWQKGDGFSLRSVYRIIRLLRTEKIHILHVHDLGPLVYGSLAKLLCFGRVRLVVTVHTAKDIEQNPRYQQYYRIFLRFADRIIAVSPGVQSALQKLGVSPERIEVIPNGAVFSSIPARGVDAGGRTALRQRLLPNLPSDFYDARWILCLARLHPGKGQDVVLNIWSALPEQVRATAVLLIVGQETEPGYRRVLEDRIVSLPNAERVIVVGPSECPLDWIQSADVFVSGSLLEGMPLAPLEAAGSGLPTLLSNIEGHHFLEPWTTYFDPAKPQDGAEKVIRILDDLTHQGETGFFESRWKETESLRKRWGVPAMTASYAELFQGGSFSD
jgi:glycosyltransferase involved in cell wall biosynthesis